MIHHVSLGSNDVQRARTFFNPLMSLIGLRLLKHSARSLRYGASDIIFSIEVRYETGCRVDCAGLLD
jgi:catechol 2,3-dioxygenase-like lactoylglutathione lyase family enzyme